MDEQYLCPGGSLGIQVFLERRDTSSFDSLSTHGILNILAARVCETRRVHSLLHISVYPLGAMQ